MVRQFVNSSSIRQYWFVNSSSIPDTCSSILTNRAPIDEPLTNLAPIDEQLTNFTILLPKTWYLFVNIDEPSAHWRTIDEPIAPIDERLTNWRGYLVFRLYKLRNSKMRKLPEWCKRVTRVLSALLCMIDADDDLVNLVVGFLVLGGRLQEPFEPTNAFLRQACSTLVFSCFFTFLNPHCLMLCGEAFI